MRCLSVRLYWAVFALLLVAMPTLVVAQNANLDPQLAQQVLKQLEHREQTLRTRLAQAEQQLSKLNAEVEKLAAQVAAKGKEADDLRKAVESANASVGVADANQRQTAIDQAKKMHRDYMEKMTQYATLKGRHEVAKKHRDLRTGTVRELREQHTVANEVLVNFRAGAKQNMASVTAEVPGVAGPEIAPADGESLSEQPAPEQPAPEPPATEYPAIEPAATDAAEAATPEGPVQCDPVDAFRRLPLVTSLAAAEKLADFKDIQGNEDGQLCETCPCPTYVVDYRFDAAAEFPLPEFGLGGERMDRPGAVIYEGMRFAVQPDGRYQVRFVIETPAMPVTLRLQLLLESGEDRFTLTLPPITIPTPDQPQFTTFSRRVSPVYGNLQTIHQEGYLPVLAANPAGIQVVRRTGTARFGFGVNVP